MNRLHKPGIAALLALAVAAVAAACASPSSLPAAPAATLSPDPANPAGINVVAVETFLADVAQNVAGDRVKVQALMPIGVDLHGYQPVPADITRVADSQVLIVNGAGVEEFLDELLRNAGGERSVIEASAGLASRAARESEADPHFWLDPIHVIRYVENIRDGLSRADPEGASVYAANAAAYIDSLKALDRWIVEQVNLLPAEARKLVTNHDSLGYYADRYGFDVVGTVVPSTSSTASPSAQQLAQLVDRLKEVGARAIFLEMGSNLKLVEQVAQEAGITVVSELYSHSVSDPGGPAPTYIEMMRYNTRAIVDALR